MRTIKGVGLEYKGKLTACPTVVGSLPGMTTEVVTTKPIPRGGEAEGDEEAGMRKTKGVGSLPGMTTSVVTTNAPIVIASEAKQSLLSILCILSIPVKSFGEGPV